MKRIVLNSCRTPERINKPIEVDANRHTQRYSLKIQITFRRRQHNLLRKTPRFLRNGSELVCIHNWSVQVIKSRRALYYWNRL